MRIYTLIIGLVLLTACNTIQSGRIEAKNYAAAYTYVTMEPIYTSNGKGRTVTSYYPVTHYVPESYSITIRGKDKDGKEGTNTIAIPAVTYGQYEVGDWYPKTERGGSFK